MSESLISLARLRELHTAPKNVINENMRYATAPQMAEFHAMHEAFPALLAVLEAAEDLIEARCLGSRERLEKALRRFSFDV